MHFRTFLLMFTVSAVGLPALAGASETPVSDHSGWYFSGKGGPAFSALRGVEATGGGTVNDSNAINVIGGFGMAAGYQWMYEHRLPLRTEVEFMNRTEVTYDASPLLQGGSSGALASTVQNVTAMFNGYWHFPVHSDKWWPYVSAGLGWSHNTVKSQYTPTGGSMTKYTSTSNNLAWSVGVGASLKLGRNMMNDIELRYVDLGSADWGLPASQNVKTSGIGGFSSVDLVFSLRYMF